MRPWLDIYGVLCFGLLRFPLQAIPGLGLPRNDSEDPARGFLVVRFWHDCSPCEVSNYATVSPTIFCGQRASEGAVAAQFDSVCLAHLARRRCFQGSGLGSALSIVSLRSGHVAMSKDSPAQSIVRAAKSYGLAAESVQVAVADWEVSLLESEARVVEDADVLTVEGELPEHVLAGDRFSRLNRSESAVLHAAVLQAYWSGAVVVCVGTALETVVTAMPWMHSEKLASAECFKSGSAKLEVNHESCAKR